jgi:SLT domain-containing protein
LFGEDHWEYIDFIVKKESSWNNEAQNPTSSAFGYFQFLSGTWATVGCEKTYNPHTQVDCGLQYIKQRYGTPKKAYQFWIANHWY